MDFIWLSLLEIGLGARGIGVRVPSTEHKKMGKWAGSRKGDEPVLEHWARIRTPKCSECINLCNKHLLLEPLTTSIPVTSRTHSGSFPSWSNSTEPPTRQQTKAFLPVLSPSPPGHHPKCSCPSVQHLGHNAEHFLLLLAVFPSGPTTVSSACVVLPSQAPELSPDPLGSPACFSNPVIILLATLPSSLHPATGNGCARQPETLFSQNWHK